MLQFISHYNERYNYLDGIRLALAGGCRWVQLRMKEASEDELLAMAIQVMPLCQEVEATFIIDDHVTLVKTLCTEAEQQGFFANARRFGVHLGKKDMPINEARKMLGSQVIIGGTANTFDDVRSHYLAGADYIGCGPFRYTTTKKNLSPVLGLEGYRTITARMRSEHIDLPIVAIGGITMSDIPSIMQTGVTGIALSGAILNAPDPVTMTQEIINTIA